MSKTIEIEDFYTEENEKKGVWHEPIIDGEPCGLKFLLIGIHSAEAIKNMEYYDQLIDELDEISDPEERAVREKEIDAERVASLTKDVKAADGADILVGGQKVVFDKTFIKKLYMEAPLFKMDNIEFAIKTSNFMKKKDNE